MNHLNAQRGTSNVRMGLQQGDWVMVLQTALWHAHRKGKGWKLEEAVGEGNSVQ